MRSVNILRTVVQQENLEEVFDRNNPSVRVLEGKESLCVKPLFAHLCISTPGLELFARRPYQSQPERFERLSNFGRTPDQPQFSSFLQTIEDEQKVVQRKLEIPKQDTATFATIA